MSTNDDAPSSRTLKQAAGAVLAAGVALGAGAASAQSLGVEDTLKDVEITLGGVPSFVTSLPKAALPGAWQEIKAMEFSGPTALDVKTKALIGIAVGAQIPCHYCVWSDTNTARHAGATDEEIAEAVAMAALTRHWSTFFHGLQVDFDQFKAELGGN